jgi:hypothetical protein
MFSRPRIEQLQFDASTAGAGEIKIFESLYMLMLFTFWIPEKSVHLSCLWKCKVHIALVTK